MCVSVSICVSCPLNLAQFSQFIIFYLPVYFLLKEKETWMCGWEELRELREEKP